MTNPVRSLISADNSPKQVEETKTPLSPPSSRGSMRRSPSSRALNPSPQHPRGSPYRRSALGLERLTRLSIEDYSQSSALSSPFSISEHQSSPVSSPSVIPKVMQVARTSVRDKIEDIYNQSIQLFPDIALDPEFRAIVDNREDLIKGAQEMSRLVDAFLAESRRAFESDDEKEMFRVSSPASSARSDATFDSVSVSSLVHELRIPLNCILIGLQEVTNAETDKEIRTAIHVAYKNLQGKIFEIPRVESDTVKLQLNPTAFTLSAILEEMRLLNDLKANGDGVHLTVDTSFSEADFTQFKYRGDRVKIGQILTNFIGNAIKFSPKDGTVQIYVKKVQGGLVPPNTEMIRFGVRDQGAGISQADKSKLFKLFSQGAQPKQQKVTSSGVGLHFCRTLATLMGGKTDVDSITQVGDHLEDLNGVQWNLGEKEVGSDFYFEIPLKKGEFTPENIHSPVVAKPRKTVFSHAPRILMADDDRITKTMYGKGLHDRGQRELVFVNDGQAAVDAISNSVEPYDVVVMDLNMPKLNGLQAAARIFQSHIQGNQKPPHIILCTGDDRTIFDQARKEAIEAIKIEDRDIKHLVKEAFDRIHYLGKPIVMNSFVETVNAIMTRAG